MKIKLPQNETILYALGVGQTLGMAYAGYVYESTNNPVLLTLAVLRGAVVGWAISFSIAVGAQKAPRIQAKRARLIGYVSCAALLIIVPVFMAPAIFLTMPSIGPDWLKVIVASCYALAPDAAAVVVAVISGSLQGADNSEQVHKSKSNVSKEQKQIPEEKKPAKQMQCKYGCGFERETVQAMNAHYRGCKSNPANTDGKANG